MSKILSRTLLCLLITLWRNDFVDTKSVNTLDYQPFSVPLSPYGGTNFDYDFNPDSPLDNNRQNSNSFMEYWQNMVRNVRLPFINWNINNPLANIFNSEVEEPPIQRRQKSKRKRKSSKRKHENKTKNEQQTNEKMQFQDEQQMLLQQYPTYMDQHESYFYDPETNGYYKVTRVNDDFGSFTPESQLTSIYAEPQFISEPLDYGKSIAFDMPNKDAVDKEDNEHNMNLEKGRIMNWKEGETARQSFKNVEQQRNRKFPLITEKTLHSILDSYPHGNHFNPRRQRTRNQRRVKSANKPRSRQNQKFYYRIKRN